MSTLVLGVAGKAIGTALLGPLGGIVGGVAGVVGGGLVDNALFGAKRKPQINEGPRLDDLYVTASTEGASIARVYGRLRVSGQIIWATKIKEVQHVEKVKTSGGKGASSQKTINVTYDYSVSFAVALCEGPITHVWQVYADGKALDLTKVTARVYLGDEAQGPDPRIEAIAGAGNVPGYRGLAYVVFEDLPLAAFGNRVPVITAEVARRAPALPGKPLLEDLVTGVTMIPAMGEFTYATEPVAANDAATLVGQNTISGGVDFLAALDQLAIDAPNCRHVSLVAAWQGTDLRAGACRIVPKAEVSHKSTNVTWMAGGLTREVAELVTLLPNGKPAIGGAPSDLSVVQALRELKRRGYAVALYPFVMMDIAPGNGLPDPYGRAEQPPYPWRGRITCTPAIGEPGTPDKTAAARDQIDAFFGSAGPADLAWTGQTVTCARDEWSFRRFMLHFARIAEAAGGVDTFVMGSEMIGITTVRSGPGSFPAVAQLKALAADVRAILGPATAITYGADWTEFGNYRPADGSGDVYFHLDPLWSDPNIDFVGIDNYMPIADWRDGFDHLDARDGKVRSTYDVDYLRANIAGGELYDWYYPSLDDRDVQNRVPIADTASGEDWVFRIKDLRGWWANAHHDRPGGVRAAAGTGWMPQGKPIRFTELGCACVDRGANQPNVFIDPKSSESFLPYYSNGRQDLAMQRAFLEAHMTFWQGADTNPVSAVYGGRMVDPARIYVWTWDARPYPLFPRQGDVWGDALNYRLGHWLNGRLGLAQLPNTVADISAAVDVAVDVTELYGTVQGYAITDVQSPRDSLAPLTSAFFFDATETGGRIAFRPLQGAPAARFTADQLVAREDGDDITRIRGEETAVPGVISLRYVDPERDFQSAAVEVRRMNGRASAVSRTSLPLCLDEGGAWGIAQAMLYRAVVERETLRVTLPPSALALDPLDVVTVSANGLTSDYRLTQIGMEAGRPASATQQDNGVFDYRDATTTVRTPDAPVTVGVGRFRILDLPLFRPDAVPFAAYFGAITEPWTPVAVFRSFGGGSFVPDALVGARSLIGTLSADLYSGPVWRWDRVNALYVETPAGTELSSAPATDVLNGANLAAVLTPSGDWELVQWTSATLLGVRRYRLDGLLRGQFGTEFAMGRPTPAGAPFVVLSDALVQSAMPSGTRALPQDFRWGPASEPADAPSYATATVTVQGVGLRPYAPAQPRLRQASSGDLTVSWVPRTRIDGDAWEQAEVPLGEETEAYVLEIHDGDAIRRSVAVGTPFAVYALADQVADFGAAVSSLDVAITQLSTRFGRGTTLRTTLHV